MKDLWRIGGVLLLLQAVLIGAYLHLSDQPTDASVQASLSTAPPTQRSGTFSSLRVEKRNGEEIVLDPSRPTLIHLWATWCPPCRAELPGLLALDGDRLQVVAIALDPNWEALDSFFDDELPPQVVRGDAHDLRSQLAIQTLPVTFLLNHKSPHTLRFDGARDWSSKSFQTRWLLDLP